MLRMAARLCTFLICFFATVKVKAEYRVFTLEIESETGRTRTVTSTLDDIQYPSYYPLRKGEKIKIQDTWMCYRRSDSSQDPAQRYCPNPRAPASVPTSPKASAK